MRVRVPEGKSNAARCVAAVGGLRSTPPVEAAGDHQMEDEPEIVVDSDGDALADAAELDDFMAEGVVDGRIGGTKKKGAGNLNTAQRLAEDARSEGVEVNDDIRQLGHFDSL